MYTVCRRDEQNGCGAYVFYTIDVRACARVCVSQQHLQQSPSIATTFPPVRRRAVVVQCGIPVTVVSQ